jgi:xanthosine utilization system XapX-like protein
MTDNIFSQLLFYLYNAILDMRIPIRTIIATLLIGLNGFYVSAQVTTTQAPQGTPITKSSGFDRDTVKNTDPSLNGQYQFMLSRTRTSPDGYKMVARYRLDQLWKSINDTLRKERAERKGLQQKLVEQEKTVNYLKTEISGKESSLKENTNKVNEIRFLGIPFEKGTYNIIVWSVIGILAIALVIIIVRSGKSISEAKHRSQLYNEISDEYQAYKSKAVEKERKLARELQDERNKLEELMNNRK